MICITLHLNAYQPPTQKPQVRQEIFHQSYLPLIETTEPNQEITFSLNIAKSLGERLQPEFLARINALAGAGRIEIIDTAAYHYLLPLTPYNRCIEQLKINREFYRRHFPDTRIRGAFPPELATSPNVAFAVSASGAGWMFMDDLAPTLARINLPEHERAPHAWIPETCDGLRLLLASRMWSKIISDMRYPNSTPVRDGNEFAHRLIAEQIKWVRRSGESPTGYLSLVLDFETFGHHHKNTITTFLVPFFRAIAAHHDACALLPSKVIGMFPKRSNFPIATGTWATSEEELRSGIPFPKWAHPRIPFHRAWNEFKNDAFAATRSNDPAENPELVTLMQTAFYSCSPWQFANGNKKVAAWCLPLFQRISELIPQSPMTQNLPRLVEEMRRLTA